MENINNDKIDLRRYIAAAKRYKWLYIAALVVMMSGSIFFALTREPKYEINASMLVESEQSSGSGALAGLNQMMGMFSSLGGFGGLTSENEVYVAQSNNVLERTVKEMQLNRKYYIREGFMRKKSLYDDSPVLVVADDEYFDTVNGGMQFKIKLKKNGKADIKAQKGWFTTVYEAEDVDLPTTIEVDNAKFTLLPTDAYVKGAQLEMSVSLSSNVLATAALYKSLKVKSVTKTDFITLSLSDPNLKRGKAILNTLMRLYNEFRLDGKANKASKGVEFIDEQLALAYESLIHSEASMEKFKSENDVTDIQIELEVMLEAASKLNEGMLAARAQTMICDLMLKFLTTEESKYSLLPSMSTGATTSISSGDGESASGGSGNSIINSYNELILKRMRLLRSARPDNKALAEVTANIDAMRGAVIESVEQQKNNVGAAMDVLEGQYNQFASRLKSSPSLERQYMDIARDMKLNNQVYLVLLSKKVDYQMKMASNDVPATIIEDAYCEKNKASNMRSLIYPVLGLFVALLFPSLFVLYMTWRRKEITREYDMPLSVRKGGYATYEDVLQLRSDILSSGNSKLIPIGYAVETNSGRVAEAVTSICRHISDTGRKIAIVDLNNACGCGGQLDDISNKVPEPVKYAGFDCLGYTGSVASDMLLNDKFCQLLEQLYDKYDSVIVSFEYSDDAACAINKMSENVSIVYMVEGGVTRRRHIDQLAESLRKEQKMMFWIC